MTRRTFFEQGVGVVTLIACLGFALKFAVVM